MCEAISVGRAAGMSVAGGVLTIRMAKGYFGVSVEEDVVLLFA